MIRIELAIALVLFGSIPGAIIIGMIARIAQIALHKGGC